MLTLPTADVPVLPSVEQYRRHDRTSWWCWYGVCVVATLAVGALAASTSPRPFSLAFLMLVMGLVVAIVRPVAGIYIAVFFAILGDPGITWWYPFTKNFSSQESILFVSNGISFSPLELFLVALAFGWILQMMSDRRVRFQRGRLLWPLLVFTGFLLFGLANGLARGGDRTAAIWEIRPLLSIPVLYILVTNLFQRSRQYQRLYWFVFVAVVINSLIALRHYQGLSAVDKDSLESLVAHGATLPMNAMLVLVFSAWMFRRHTSWGPRVLLPILAIPVVIVYMISQRRAAFVALIAGLILLGVVLFWTNRRSFWRVLPVCLVVVTLYTGAFWNSQSTAGFPAQAIKSVVAPDQVSERDQNSDNYRIMEKTDIVATIRSSQIIGIGFGQPFLRPVPLPTITPFLLEPYVPHNSILWVWMKAGVGGFLALLFLLSLAMRTGARAVLQAPRGDHAAVMLTSVAFVAMFVVFAYVDIAWDPQNAVLLAVALAHIGSATRLWKAEPGTAPGTPEASTTEAKASLLAESAARTH